MRKPDLRPLLAAARSVGRQLKPGDIVVVEFDGLSRRHRGGMRTRHGWNPGLYAADWADLLRDLDRLQEGVRLWRP